MSYHWLTDLEPYKGTPFYKEVIKIFAKLTTNPLFKYLGKEDHLQIKVACYMATNYPEVLMHHSPNEGKRTPIEQLRVKYFGVKALPDVMVYKHGWVGEGICHGLAIELKIKPNKLSKNQKEILNKLKESGWKTAICYNLEDTITQINDYLK